MTALLFFICLALLAGGGTDTTITLAILTVASMLGEIHTLIKDRGKKE